MKLQKARQHKGDGPQAFTNHCRMLEQKVMGRDNDPVAQRIHRENSERMCLASFVAGLNGIPGRYVTFSNPQIMSQELATALVVTEAEKQEKSTETFYTGLQNSSGSPTLSFARKYRENGSSKRSADAGRQLSITDPHTAK